PHGWKLIGAKLVEPFRRSEVLEPVQTQVEQAICAREIAGCLRDEDLAAVTGGGDARSAMHVQPDVSLVGYERLARVQSDAYPNRSFGERFARRLRRRQRVGSFRKRYAERVSLRADLHATVAREL